MPQNNHQKRFGNCGSSVGGLFSYCIKMLVIGKRLGPYLLWTFYYLANSVTKWNRACDLRRARLISCIHHSSNCKQYCHVGKQATDCKLILIQDADLARHLTDSNSTSGGVLCVYGSHTLVPISWICKKSTQQFPRIALKLNLYRLMQGYAWRAFQH